MIGFLILKSFPFICTYVLVHIHSFSPAISLEESSSQDVWYILIHMIEQGAEEGSIRTAFEIKAVLGSFLKYYIVSYIGYLITVSSLSIIVHVLLMVQKKKKRALLIDDLHHIKRRKRSLSPLAKAFR